MRDYLKFKVIIGFAIASLALFAALYITITNFYQLKDSIEELTIPDHKVQKLNKILEDIYETERLVKYYTLTENSQFLADFDKYTQSIQADLDSLKREGKNPREINQIDSIEALWKNRTDLFYEFIKLEEEQRRTNLASEAIRKISTEAMDTALLTTTTTTKKVEVSNKKTLPLPQGNQAKVEDKPEQDYNPGLFNRFFKLFQPKKSKQDAVAMQGDSLEMTETQITYDTIISEEDAREIWTTVIDILSEYREKESFLRKNSSQNEYMLLQGEAEVMDRIRTMVKDLQKIEAARAIEQSSESKSIAQKSILTILIIGMAGMFISIIFISIILNDITKSNYYKRRLEAAKKRAEKLAKAKEEFLANMSHEIRTPLSAILGFTEQLLTLDIEEKHRFYLQAVKNSSDHLLSTVNDILDFSKIEAGRLALENVPFRISDQVKEVHETLYLKAKEKNIEFRYDVDGELDYVVTGDPFRLKQILINLVGNAIKFTEQGSVIITGSKIIKDLKSIWIKISITDTGIGIEKDKLKTIFKGFSQADATITRRYGGTGLGLAITQKLVDLHDGKLYVESEPEAGSVFTVELCYKLAEAQLLEEIPQQELLKPGFNSKQALVVDDDEYNLLLFHTILKKWGMNPDMASNGAEGIEAIRKKKYDLILSDIQMPEKSGMELVSEIRKDKLNKNTPVLAITANVMKQDIDQYLEAGFNDYVIKPFREKELYQKILKAMDLAQDDASNEAVEVEKEEGGSTKFSLFEIERFADNDPQAMATMLRGLIDNNRINIYHLHEYTGGKKWDETAKVAHKMMPSFNHLKAFGVTAALRKIGELSRNEKEAPQIARQVEYIKSETKEIFKALEEKVKEYESSERIAET